MVWLEIPFYHFGAHKQDRDVKNSRVWSLQKLLEMSPGVLKMIQWCDPVLTLVGF